MKDPEFILLRNRFLLAIGVIIIFIIPTFFVIKNKILHEESTIITSINKEKKVLIYVVENDCSNCKKYKKLLSNLNVKYYVINKSKDKEYKTLIRKLNISSEDIISPTIIYIEDSSLVATLVDIKNEEDLNLFIENYNLSNN